MQATTTASVEKTVAAFYRLGTKKNKKRIWGWQALLAWQPARLGGQLSDESSASYRSTLSYVSDEAAYFREYVSSADVSVLGTGFAVKASDLIENSFLEPIMRVQPDAVGPAHLADHPVLVVPTGGLYGLSQNTQFKAGLESYVRLGGTAVVFSQQRGSDFAVLPTPSGEPIRGYGWFEDNSCYWGGAYVETFHPILASQSQALVTSAIDGYFDSIPEGSTILLRRTKNSMPAMFMYPYGDGWVIVTSSYDDWGGFNQSTPGARALIRDTIAWAKKPGELPVNAPGSTASITLSVKNVTALPASQVRLVLLSPSRNRVIREETVAVSCRLGGRPRCRSRTRSLRPSSWGSTTSTTSCWTRRVSRSSRSPRTHGWASTLIVDSGEHVSIESVRFSFPPPAVLRQRSGVCVTPRFGPSASPRGGERVFAQEMSSEVPVLRRCRSKKEPEQS